MPSATSPLGAIKFGAVEQRYCTDGGYLRITEESQSLITFCRGGEAAFSDKHTHTHSDSATLSHLPTPVAYAHTVMRSPSFKIHHFAMIISCSGRRRRDVCNYKFSHTPVHGNEIFTNWIFFFCLDCSGFLFFFLCSFHVLCHPSGGKMCTQHVMIRRQQLSLINAQRKVPPQQLLVSKHRSPEHKFALSGPTEHTTETAEWSKSTVLARERSAGEGREQV